MPPASPENENEMTPFEEKQIKGVTVKYALSAIAILVASTFATSTFIGGLKGGVSDLKTSVDKLSGKIDAMSTDNQERDRRINTQDVQLKTLELRVSFLERQMNYIPQK